MRSHLSKVWCGLLLAVLSMTAAVSAQEVEEAVRADEKTMLDSRAGYWRVRVCWKTPVLVDERGAVKPLLARQQGGEIRVAP